MKILELEVRLKRGTPYLPLVKTLRGVCGLNVEILEDSYEKGVILVYITIAFVPQNILIGF